MKIIFYDVEHGSCCHIITPNNKHILVDVGSKTNNSIVEYIKRKYFNGYGGNIDELIITHPHEDHIYDLPKLREKLSPRVLHRPQEAFDIKPTQNTYIHQNIVDVANAMNKSYNQPVNLNELPTEKIANGGILFEFISPKLQWTTKDDLNTFSNIIIVTAYEYKFVLTGDNPKSILKAMMDENYENICSKVKNATVLLAPHHGRTGEFCQEFFSCVNPYLTVVSDKPIEHETQNDTARLYKGRGANLYGQDRYVLTTRNEGTITFDIGQGYCNVSWGQEGY